MKLNKKFLASFMAMTMAAAPMSAYADTPYTITGTGTITILETEIYNVVLPTNESLDFNVDPFGILNLGSNETLETVVSNAAGTVTSSATAVINKSSMPLDVKMEFYFSQTGANIASNAAVSLGSLDAVKNNEADLYLEVLPLSGATLNAPIVTGNAISAEAIGMPVSDKAVTLSNSATALSFSSLGTALTSEAVAIVATGEATTSTGTAIEFSLQDVAYAYDVITGVGVKPGTVTAAAVLSETAIDYDYRNVYAFAITGYANPKSKDKWLAIHNADSDLKLMVKFTLTAPETIKTITNIKGEGQSFNFTVLKSDLSAIPTKLYASIGGKWYDMSLYSTVKIEDKGNYYYVSLTGWTNAPSNGSVSIYLTTNANTTRLYEGTVTFGQ